MSKSKNMYTKAYKQNKVNRVTKKNKEYGGKAPSKSQKAYINGNISKSAEGGAYYISQQKKEGKRAYGYEHDDLYTGGRKASNYKKLKNGENPYEARYLRQKGSKTIPGGTYKDSGKKYGARKVSNNRLLTKDEKASFNKYGRLNHAEFKPKEKYIDWDNEREVGGKFEDRLKLKKLDGMATAKANQRKGKHLNNAIEYGKGFLKDTVGDAGGDLLKIGDRYASSAMAGFQGALEQSGNVFKGVAEGNMKKHYNKGLIKKMVDKNLKESDETGWGRSAGSNIRETMERQNPDKELSKSDRVVSTIAGTAFDLSNPVDLISSMFKIGGKGLKGALASIDDMRKGTTDLSNAFVPKSFTDLRGKGGNVPNTPSKASDEVFFPSDNIKQQLVENKHKGFNAEDYNLDKAFERSVGKVDNIKQPKIVTDKPVIDNFLTELEVKTAKQRNIDGRTLNKKYTQTKDGYVPNLLNNIDETDDIPSIFKYKITQNPDNVTTLPTGKTISIDSKTGKRKVSYDAGEYVNGATGDNKVLEKQLNMFPELKGNMTERKQMVKHEKLDELSEFNLPQRKKYMSEFLNSYDPNDSGNTLSAYQSISKKINSKTNIDDVVNFLNDKMFSGSNIIRKDIKQKDLSGFVKNEIEFFKTLESFNQAKIKKDGVAINKLSSKLDELSNKRNWSISQLTDQHLQEKIDYIKNKYGNSPSGLRKNIENNENYIKKLKNGEVKVNNSKSEIKRLFNENEELKNTLKKAINERNAIGDMVDDDWVNFNGKNKYNQGLKLGDDITERINTNSSENFVQSHAQIANDDKSYINKQLWDIVSANVGGGKRAGYYSKGVDISKGQLNDLSKEYNSVKEAFESLENPSSLDVMKFKLNEKRIYKQVEELKVDIKSKKEIKKKMGEEFRKIKELVSDDPISQQSVVDELLGDTYKKFPHLKTNGDKIEKVKDMYKPFAKLQPGEGVSKTSVNIARRIAEQHDIKDPIRFITNDKNLRPVVDKKLFVENKRQIQKLAELRVLQRFTKGGTSKVMDDAVGLLIKEHMTNMKSNMPIEEYKKLTNGINKYKQDLTQAYNKYNSSKNVDLGDGFQLIKKPKDPLDNIGNKLYNKKDIGAQHGDNFGKEVKKLSDEFVNGRDANPISIKDGRKLKLNNDLPFEKLKNPSERIDPKNLGGIDYSKVPESIPSKQKFKKEPIPDNVNEYGEVIGSFKPNVDVPKTTPLDDIVKEVPKDVQKNVPKISDDIAQELTEHGVEPNTKPPKEKPKDMSPSLYKRWMTSYKRGVTQFNPGWHVQNYFQNKGQNYLSMGNKAFAPQTEAKNLRKAIMNNESNNPLVDMAKELNVMGGFGEDVGSKGLTKIGDKMQQSKIFDKLGASEETARLHHWIDRLDKGDTPEQALKSVNKYLFDYSKANKLDKGMKNIDPFWTFHSQNAKLMGESVFTNNGKMGNIKRAMDGFQQEIPEDEKQAKDSMYRDIQAPGKSMKDSVNKQQYNYLYDNDTLPSLKDALPPLDDTGEWAKTKLNPLIQMAMQIAKKENGFGNEVVDNKEEFDLSDMSKYFYEDAPFGTTSEGRWIKDMAKTVNPILPTLVNTLDKQHDAKLKVDKKKQSEEMSNKQILNEWIKQLTGHKGNWYKNIK